MRPTPPRSDAIARRRAQALLTCGPCLRRETVDENAQLIHLMFGVAPDSERALQRRASGEERRCCRISGDRTRRTITIAACPNLILTDEFSLADVEGLWGGGGGDHCAGTLVALRRRLTCVRGVNHTPMVLSGRRARSP